MVNTVKFFGKLIVPVSAAVVGLLVFMFPVAGLIEAQAPVSVQEPVSAPSLILDGEDIEISRLRGASPAIDVGNNGTYIAVAYYKQGANNGGVHVKSATKVDGWLTTEYLGTGENPRLAFSRSRNNHVFVVWEKDNGQAIGFASCKLAPLTPPVCAKREVTRVPNLQSPDVAVSNNGNDVAHVVWVQGGDIRTARSTNDGQNWTIFPADPDLQSDGLTDFETPRLAVGGNALHLTFRSKTQGTNLGEAILYHRLSLAGHSGLDAQDFTIGGEVSAGYRDLANPTIAADDQGNVYLAWDGQQIGPGPRFDDFGLMRVTSTNGGQSWSTALHITEDTNASGGVGGGAQDPPKISRQPEDAVPIQEGTLQPSLTLSGSGYALAWQQRDVGGGGCSERGNASAEIQLAYTNTQWITDVAADDPTQYSIDPDLAVDETGVRHLVFMKDADAANCQGGEAIEYRINYRGPFTVTINDGGEDLDDPNNRDPNAPGNPRFYFPFIFKGLGLQ